MLCRGKGKIAVRFKCLRSVKLDEMILLFWSEARKNRVMQITEKRGGGQRSSLFNPASVSLSPGPQVSEEESALPQRRAREVVQSPLGGPPMRARGADNLIRQK